ncbi:MAG: phage tail tape measure protein [Pantoea sp.]|nr:phage tail tape measure protein [Pantoea sp.]
MSILDSFYFVLKADSKDAVKGINQAGESFDELKTDVKVGTVDISRNFQTMGANVGETLAGMARGFIGIAAAAAAGILSIDGIGESINRVIAKASDAKSLGVPIEQYDALSQAVAGAGVELDEYRDALIDTNEAIGNAMLDGAGTEAKTFKSLGIGLRNASGEARNAAEIFTDLAAAAERLDPARFTALTRQLGITDPKQIQLLQLGSANLLKQIELAKERGVMDQKQQIAAMELAQAQRELRAQFDSFGDAIARNVVPPLTKVLEAINKLVHYVDDHKGFFKGLGIAAAAVSVWSFRGALVSLLGTIGRFAIAAAPFIAVGLAVGLVIAAIEDLYHYYNETPDMVTVTGRLAEKFSSVRDFLQASKTEVMALWEGMKQFGSSATQIWQGIIDKINSFNDNKAFTEWVANAKDALTKFRDWVQQLGTAIGDFLYDIFAGIVNGTIDQLNKLPGVHIERMPTGEERTAARGTKGLQSDGKAVEGVPLVPEVSLDESEQHAQAAKRAHPVTEQVPGIPVVPAMVAAQSSLSEASTTPLNSISQNSLNTFNGGKTVNANQQIDKVEIHTSATDPNAILDVFNNGMGGQWKTAVAQVDDGISH